MRKQPAPPEPSPDDRARWLQIRIECGEFCTAEWRKSVDSIFAMGDRLKADRDRLPPDEFAALLAKGGGLPFHRTVAQRLMGIASSSVFKQVAHVRQLREHLPPSYATIDAIKQLRLSADELEEAIQSGIIHPGMQRRDVALLKPSPDDGDDLDEPEAPTEEPEPQTTDRGISDDEVVSKAAYEALANELAELKAMITKALDDPKPNRALYRIRCIIEGQGDPGDGPVASDPREAKYFDAMR